MRLTHPMRQPRIDQAGPVELYNPAQRVADGGEEGWFGQVCDHQVADFEQNLILSFRLLQVIDVSASAHKPHDLILLIAKRNRKVYMPVVLPVGTVEERRLERPSPTGPDSVPENLPDAFFVVWMQARGKGGRSLPLSEFCSSSDSQIGALNWKH